MDHLGSVELAVKNEQSEMAFYRRQAARSRNRLARAMFERLAADEQEHLERIGELHRKLIEAGRWPERVPLEVSGTDIRRVLEETARSIESATDHDQDDLQALERAAEFEARGSAFYRQLSADCANAREKEFFGFLAEIENTHRLSILDSLAYLQDPAGWMMQHGRAGLDGA